MLLAEFIKEAVPALEALYPGPEARSIVLMLCEHLLGTKSYTHIIEPQYIVPEDKEDELNASVDRLAMGEPIQHIIGSAEFCGRPFRVNRDVLIPRPETEAMVNEAVRELLRLRGASSQDEPLRVLDLCTGSGCIAWSVALSVPQTEVVAVDVSDNALAVAGQQDFGHECEEKGFIRPLFVKADVLDAEQDFDHGSFDVVLSNPPYIMDSEKALMRRNVLDYEPAIALFVRDDDPLVFYRAAASWAQRFLRPEGLGIVEINEQLGKPTAALFEEAGFNDVQLIRDFLGKDRFVSFRK